MGCIIFETQRLVLMLFMQGPEGLFIVRESSISGAVAISCVQEHEVLHHLLEFGTPGPGGTRTNPRLSIARVAQLP